MIALLSKMLPLEDCMCKHSGYPYMVMENVWSFQNFWKPVGNLTYWYGTEMVSERNIQGQFKYILFIYIQSFKIYILLNPGIFQFSFPLNLSLSDRVLIAIGVVNKLQNMTLCVNFNLHRMTFVLVRQAER